MTNLFKDGLIYSADEGTCSYVLTPEQVRQLYDAFKARLKAEATLNVWPE